MTRGSGEKSANGGHLRASMRMIASLAGKRAWIESITDEMRAEVGRQLEDGLRQATTPRETIALTKALAALERADIERAKLLLDAEKQQPPEPEQTDAEKWQGAVGTLPGFLKPKDDSDD